MKIEIIGGGDRAAQELLDNTRQAVTACRLIAPVKIYDPADAPPYDYSTTPALFIDQELVSAGRSLNVRQVEDIIRSKQ